MKQTFLPIALTAALLLILTGSCKKNNPISNDPTAAADPLSTLSMPTDADGALIAVCTISQQSLPGIPGGGVDVKAGTAVAVFGDLDGGNFEDAGTVDVYAGQGTQKYSLEKQDNNSYVFKPGTSNPQGPGFEPANTNTIPYWDVPGKAIAENAGNTGFPAKPIISSSQTITKASGYTFTLSADPGADKILYIIASGNKFASKTITAGQGSNYTTAVFSASELNDLPASDNALIQAVPYNQVLKVLNGKNYYFINEVVVSESASLQ